jgi:hypothetical protein
MSKRDPNRPRHNVVVDQDFAMLPTKDPTKMIKMEKTKLINTSYDRPDCNDITGAKMTTGITDDKYRDGWERIWGNKREEVLPIENTTTEDNVGDK